MEIHLDDILNGLEWSRESFLDFCILCGTDYNESLKGVGPVGAFKAIQTHHSIPAFLKTVQVDSALLQFETCRSIFTTPCSQAIVSKVDMTIVPIQIRFNPILTVQSIIALKKKYPTQWIREFIDSYDTYITFE
jgi:5'-3' exonuclease